MDMAKQSKQAISVTPMQRPWRRAVNPLKISKLNRDELREARQDALLVMAETTELLEERVSPVEMAELLTRLSYATASPQNNLTSQDIQLKIAVYRDGLSDVPASALREAIEECVKTEKWFPAVATIREASSPAWRRLQSTQDGADRVSHETKHLLEARE
jgi:hypothetical protein